MERLHRHLRIEICKFLDGTDIVNVCEALPFMKSILASLTIKGILRSYVKQMEWVDAILCRMLYSKLAVTELAAESAAEADSEGESLCRAIRYYQDGCRSPPMHISNDLPNHGRNILSLILGSSIMDLDLYTPFIGTIRGREFRSRRQSYQKCSVGADCVETVTRMPNYDIQLKMDDLEGDSAQYIKSFKFSTLRAFDGVVYMIDSALQCHVEDSLPFGLRRLIFRITHLADMRLRRFPMLLILDAESKATEDATSRGDHFEYLIAGLHRLDRISLRGYGGSSASFSPDNWWRVCRLHQRGGVFVNLHEAFQMAALQIANTDAGGSSQGYNVSANSLAMLVE